LLTIALITGGLDQIRSYIAALILDRGDEVYFIDYLATGRKEYLEYAPNLRVEIASITDYISSISI
jgi:nucleoside-diphosphate-sugar epimerase